MHEPRSRQDIKPEDLEKLKIFEIKGFGLKKTNRGIKYEWDDLTDKQRLAALQECENRISKFEKRPSIPLYLKEPKELAQDTISKTKNTEHQGNNAHYLHTQDPSQKRIEFNSAFFSKLNNRYEIIRTFFEESRHAYQLYSLDNFGTHVNAVEEKEWEEDLKYKRLLESHSQKINQELNKQGALFSGLDQNEINKQKATQYQYGDIETFAKTRAERLTNSMEGHYQAIKTEYWLSKEPLLSPRAKRNLTTNNQRLAELKKTPKKTKSRKP